MIEEIKQRVEKITPGEWTMLFGGRGVMAVDANKQTSEDVCICPISKAPFDADFIAHAPADLRWAIAEIERLQMELQMLDGRLQVSEYDLQQEQADNAKLRAALDALRVTMEQHPCEVCQRVIANALKGKD